MKYIPIGLLLLLSSVQYIQGFGATDNVDPQFLFLGGVVLLTLTYLTKQKFDFIRLIKESTILKVYALLAIVSLLSISVSFNQTEALIDFSKQFSFFLLLLAFIGLLRSSVLGIYTLSLIFSFLLLTDCIYIIYYWFQIYDPLIPPGRSEFLQGFSSNLNIAGFSTLFKIPFLIILFSRTKHLIVKILSVLTIAIGIFVLLIVGSRGALLGLILFGLVFIIYNLYYKKNFLITSLFVGITVIMISTNFYLYRNSDVIRVDKRLTSFDVSNELSSTSERLTWYIGAIDGFLDKPLLGHGVGNWKIIANYYHRNYIKGYVIPYHVHNDFLQYFVETGIFGGILYVLFFIFIFRSVYKHQIFTMDEKILIILAIATFVFDSLINFPRARPIPMTNLCLLVALIIALNDEK